MLTRWKKIQLNFINKSPPEILMKIFSYLYGHDLLKCRAVCWLWLTVIDRMTTKDSCWRNLCYNEFPLVAESAYRKSDLTWRRLYRSLKLWPNLQYTLDTQEDLTESTYLQHEIQDFVLLRNEIMGVHKKDCIVYYDRNTFCGKRKRVLQNISKYSENDYVVCFLRGHDLLVRFKSLSRPCSKFVKIKHVAIFIVCDEVVYYVSKANLYKCEAINDLVVRTKVKRIIKKVIALSTLNGYLYILMGWAIYKLEDNDLVKVAQIDYEIRLYHELKKYNFLKEMDWSKHFSYYSALSNYDVDLLMRSQEITAIVPYGLVTFAGNSFGILYVLYTPDIEQFIDLCTAEPLKAYNCAQRYDHLLIKPCPIVQVDVVENESGHILYIATTERITVVKIIHEFANNALPIN